MLVINSKQVQVLVSVVFSTRTVPVLGKNRTELNSVFEEIRH